MGALRAHIVFPEELAIKIDELAGKRGRNAYVVETMRAAVHREELLQLLHELTKGEPIWKDEDHPELAAMGTAAWVRAQRSQTGERRKRIEKEWWNRK